MTIAPNAFWRRKRSTTSTEPPEGHKSGDSREPAGTSGRQERGHTDGSTQKGGGHDIIQASAQPVSETQIIKTVEQGEPESSDAEETMDEALPLVLTLTVQEGDTLESLATSIGIDKQTLIDANGGEEVLEAGRKLHWQMALPQNPQKLLEVVGQRQEASEAAEAAQAARLGLGQSSKSAAIFAIELLSPWLLLGTLALAVASLFRFSRELDDRDKSALRARAQARRKQQHSQGPKRSDRGGEKRAAPQQLQSNSLAEALCPEISGDEAAESRKREDAQTAERRLSGKGASTSAMAYHRNGAGAPSQKPAAREEPDWVNLHMVYFLSVEGRQSATFRLQPQLPHEYSLVAFQAKSDAVALRQWFLEQGEKGAEEYAISGIFPLEFLILADQNENGASFIPENTLTIRSDLSGQELWMEMMSAARSLPRGQDDEGLPSASPSVHSVLKSRFGDSFRSRSEQPAPPGSPPQEGEPLPSQNGAAPSALLADHDSRSQPADRVPDAIDSEGEPPLLQPIANSNGPGRNAAQAPKTTTTAASSAARERAETLRNPAEVAVVDAVLLDSQSSQGKSGVASGKNKEGKEHGSSPVGDDAYEVSLAGGISIGGSTAEKKGGDSLEGEPVEADTLKMAKETEELASMLDSLASIQRQTREPDTYIPKVARQFAEHYSLKEEGMKKAAEETEGFDPLAAADSKEIEEIQAILSGNLQGTGQESSDDSDSAARPSDEAEEECSETCSAPEALKTVDESFDGVETWVNEATKNFTKKNPEGAAMGSETSREHQQTKPGQQRQEPNPKSRLKSASSDQKAEQERPGLNGVTREIENPSAEISRADLKSDSRARRTAPKPPAKSSVGRRAAAASAAPPVTAPNGSMPQGSEAAGSRQRYKTSAQRAYEQQAKADEIEARLRESFAASEMTDTTASRSTQAQPASPPAAKIRSGWWKKLPVVHLPVVQQEDGSFDYLILDISMDDRVEDNHVIGFVSPEDANKFQWLFRSTLGHCSVMAVPPEKLEEGGIGGEETGLTVYRRDQLPLSPGISSKELPNLLALYAAQ